MAVRRNPHARASSTVEEIESAIKNWLRNAGDRQGGRAKRNSKNDG